MPETGIRELKTRASEIVRRVRERKVRYVITYRGRPVAILGPVEGAPVVQAAASDASAWQDLERLGKTLGKGWRSRKTSAGLLSESRR
jgi:prevent-host-death family protein